MPVIIAKPAKIEFKKKDAEFEMVFEWPYYLTVAYAQDGKVHTKKFQNEEVEQGWTFLESLTKNAFIAFLHDKHQKIYKKNEENLPPIAIHDELAYIPAGDILTLSGKTKKEYSDARRMKSFAFEEMEKSNPGIFFTYAGIWLLENIISYLSSIAFIKGDGTVNVLRPNDWDTFKGMRYFDTKTVPKKYFTKRYPLL
jgi:hypothetical protein